MGAEFDEPRTTVLERVDLALAAVAAERAPEPSGDEDELQRASWMPSEEQRHRWIVGTLGLRGLRVRAEDVARIVAARNSRILPEHQEYKLVRGLDRVFVSIEQRAARGQLPDGWFIVEAFRKATAEVGRFHNNVLRRDHPWDGLKGLSYPDPEAVSSLLDRFHQDHCYGESPESFERLHPVRRANRLMWRLARIAPFPDFNVPFGFVAATAYLRAHGYPLAIPDWSDRARFEATVVGAAPMRAPRLERALLEVLRPDWAPHS